MKSLRQLSRKQVLFGGASSLLLAGCSSTSSLLLPERQVLVPVPGTRRPQAYTARAADGSSISLYDDNGSLLMKVSTDGLNITATDGTGKTVMSFSRGDYTASVYSSQMGTAYFDQSSPNAPGSYNYLGTSMNIASSNQGTYVAPQSNSWGTLTRVSSDSGDSTSVYQPRFVNATRNSYNDYGWRLVSAGGGGGTGTGCHARICPNVGTGSSLSPHCLGVYVEFIVMTVALASLELALAILETMTAGLASFLVAAIEVMVFAYYTYLIGQVENCLQQ